MANEIPDYDDGPRAVEFPPMPPHGEPRFPTLTESGPAFVDERDFAIWLHNNAHERPPNWTPTDELRSMMQFSNLSMKERANLGPYPYDTLADMLSAGGILGAAGDDAFGMEDDAARYTGYVDDYLSEMTQETGLPDTPYQQSQQRTQAAAGKAFKPSKTVPKYPYDEVEGAIEKQFVDAARENEPEEQFKYVQDQVASETPGYRPILDEIGEAARSGQELDERKRRGLQDPAFALGPSMEMQ